MSFDSFLTRIALGAVPLADMLFDLETGIFGRDARTIRLQRPVFIVGYARAGTSILTRVLHATGLFASLTYRDLPFPLAPNIWHRIARYGDRHIDARQRGHHDGLMHDLDSPEAIEEAFWRIRDGHSYIRTSHLDLHSPQKQVLSDFDMLMRLVALRYGKQRYLSKNNNNVLRLAALARAFPDAIFIHPIRNPADHATSLWRLHLRTIAVHRTDPAKARYMRMLAHHEFGGDHRQFALKGMPASNPTDPDYWLASWIAVYRHIRRQRKPGQSFIVHHAALCDDPTTTLNAIGAFAKISKLSQGAGLIRPGKQRRPPEFSATLLAEANTLLDDLLDTKLQ